MAPHPRLTQLEHAGVPRSHLSLSLVGRGDGAGAGSEHGNWDAEAEGTGRGAPERDAPGEAVRHTHLRHSAQLRGRPPRLRLLGGRPKVGDVADADGEGDEDGPGGAGASFWGIAEPFWGRVR
jgi:hypothetical protein